MVGVVKYEIRRRQREPASCGAEDPEGGGWVRLIVALTLEESYLSWHCAVQRVRVCLHIMAHRAGRRSASTLALAGSGAVVWDGRLTECQCSEVPMSLHAANYSICRSRRHTGINLTSVPHITPPSH